jgi:ankyrin repeat protein
VGDSLIKCVFREDVAGLQKRLRKRADTEEADEDRRTPLIHAAIDNKQQMAAILLDSGANVNAQDQLGNSALHYAANGWFVEMTRLLISHGANLELEDHHGNTPLSNAVFNSRGREDVIRVLVEAEADKNHRNRHGVSPLELARSIGNFDVAQFLE